MNKSDELALGIGKALASVFTSPNVHDSNGGAANLVDALDSIARSMWDSARHLGNGEAATQGWGAIEGHARAVMDASEKVSYALDGIAGALDRIAVAMEDKSTS
jgi:hypothetical protein